MPRTKGFSSLARRRDSYVENRCMTGPYDSLTRLISRSKKPLRSNPGPPWRCSRRHSRPRRPCRRRGATPPDQPRVRHEQRPHPVPVAFLSRGPEMTS